jgi:predicted nuclease of predicted toxin-antitoxin system
MVMRIIANENIMVTVVGGLRARGHDVLWMKEASPGVADEAILAMAQEQKRLVLTHDKDFGELAYRFGLPADCGVILFRPSGNSPQSDAAQILAVLDARNDWPGHFTVIRHGRVRIRPLPPQRKPK